MRINGRSRAIPRMRYRRLSSWVFAAFFASACAKFSGTEAPADASAPSLDGAVPADVMATTDSPADAADAPSTTSLCPGGTHTFCDGFDSADFLDARWKIVTGGDRLSLSSSNVVSQPHALRVMGQRTFPNALARADALLPMPSRTIQCQAQLRVQTTNAEGSLPLALRLTGANGQLLILVFFFPGAFELGAEWSPTSGNPVYENAYKTETIPQLGAITKTTIDLSLVDQRVRLLFGDTTVASFDVDIPTALTSTAFSIGDLRVNGSTGVAVETFFDDVWCDVDRP